MTADQQPISGKEQGIFGRILGERAAKEPHRDAENEIPDQSQQPVAEMVQGIVELITRERFVVPKDQGGGYHVTLVHMRTLNEFRLSHQIVALLRTHPQDGIRATQAALAEQGFAPSEPEPDVPDPVEPRDLTPGQLREFLLHQPTGQFVRARAGVILSAISDAVTEAKKPLKDRIAELESHSEPTRFATVAERNEDLLHRREMIELVSAMLEPAGFALVRDADGETAMWVQQLPSRPQVQVFFQLPVEIQDLSPAQVYAEVHRQTGGA